MMWIVNRIASFKEFDELGYPIPGKCLIGLFKYQIDKDSLQVRSRVCRHKLLLKWLCSASAQPHRTQLCVCLFGCGEFKNSVF